MTSSHIAAAWRCILSSVIKTVLRWFMCFSVCWWLIRLHLPWNIYLSCHFKICCRFIWTVRSVFKCVTSTRWIHRLTQNEAELPTEMYHLQKKKNKDKRGRFIMLHLIYSSVLVFLVYVFCNSLFRYCPKTIKNQKVHHFMAIGWGEEELPWIHPATF